MKLDSSNWTGKETIINSCKVITVFVLCGLLVRFVLLSLQEAFSFTLLKDKQLPSNTLLGIPVCDEETQESRANYCDEKSFLIRVIFAWLVAACLCFFLFFRAAPVEEDTLPVIASTTKLGALTSSTGGKDTKAAPDPDGASSTHIDASMNKDDQDDDDAADDEDEDGEDSSSSSVGEDFVIDEKKDVNQSSNRRSSHHQVQL